VRSDRAFTGGRQPYYTSGQVARLFGVTSTTAAKWIDRGVLKGFRLPGSLKRRVAHVELIAFVCRHPEFVIELDKIFGPDWDQPLQTKRE
jgi:hypothetical protein